MDPIDYDPEECLLFWIFDAYISKITDTNQKAVIKNTLDYLNTHCNFFKITKDSGHYTIVRRVIDFAKSQEFIDSISFDEVIYLLHKLILVEDFLNSLKGQDTN